MRAHRPPCLKSKRFKRFVCCEARRTWETLSNATASTVHFAGRRRPHLCCNCAGGKERRLQAPHSLPQAGTQVPL